MANQLGTHHQVRACLLCLNLPKVHEASMLPLRLARDIGINRAAFLGKVAAVVFVSRLCCISPLAFLAIVRPCPRHNADHRCAAFKEPCRYNGR